MTMAQEISIHHIDGHIIDKNLIALSSQYVIIADSEYIYILNIQNNAYLHSAIYESNIKLINIDRNKILIYTSDEHLKIYNIDGKLETTKYLACNYKNIKYICLDFYVYIISDRNGVYSSIHVQHNKSYKLIFKDTINFVEVKNNKIVFKNNYNIYIWDFMANKCNKLITTTCYYDCISANDETAAFIYFSIISIIKSKEQKHIKSDSRYTLHNINVFKNYIIVVSTKVIYIIHIKSMAIIKTISMEFYIRSSIITNHIIMVDVNINKIIVYDLYNLFAQLVKNEKNDELTKLIISLRRKLPLLIIEDFIDFYKLLSITEWI